MTLYEGMKVTELPQVSSPLQDADLFYVVRGDTSYKMTYAQLLATYSGSELIELTSGGASTIQSGWDFPSTLIKFANEVFPNPSVILNVMLDLSLVRAGIPKNFVFINNTSSEIDNLNITFIIKSGTGTGVLHNQAMTYYGVTSNQAVIFSVTKPASVANDIVASWEATPSSGGGSYHKVRMTPGDFDYTMTYQVCDENQEVETELMVIAREYTVEAQADIDVSFVGGTLRGGTYWGDSTVQGIANGETITFVRQDNNIVSVSL